MLKKCISIGLLVFVSAALMGCGGLIGAGLRQNDTYKSTEDKFNGENMILECAERCGNVPLEVNFQNRSYISDAATDDQRQCMNECLKPNRPALEG